MKKIDFKSFLLLGLFEFSEFWWIAKVISRYGGINPLFSIILTMLLSLYLALFLYFYYVVVKIFVKFYGVYGLTFSPFVYVIFEWLKGKLFGGLPWWDIGYSLSTQEYLLQIVSIFGIEGLSFIGVMISTAIAILVVNGIKDSVSNIYAILTAGVLVLVIIFGYLSKQIEIKGEDVKIGIIQPEIPQDKKWDTSFQNEILKRLYDLSQNFKGLEVDLLLFPESSTPIEWGYDKDIDGEFISIAKSLNTNLIVGSVFEDENGLYNGAIVIGKEGEIIYKYAKTHLVPFGEYVPFEKHLKFITPIVESGGSFTSGTNLSPIKIQESSYGISICYEAIFPDLIRKEVNLGSEMLINISNDAWYKGTPALIQHFLIDRVRCVENRRFLVRSSNGGVSGIVDSKGDLVITSEIGKPSVCFGFAKKITHRTIFSRFGYSYLLFFLLFILFSLGIKIRGKIYC